MVVSGPEEGQSYKVLSESVSIGRGPQNDICLAGDKKISRKHAILKVIDKGVYVKNLSERNIIEVDGKVVSQSKLKHNSEILIGESVLRIKIRKATKPDGSRGSAVPKVPANMMQPNSPQQGYPQQQGMDPQYGPGNPLAAPGPSGMSPGQRGPDPFSQDVGSKKPDSGKRNFYIIVGGILLFFIWIGTSESPEKKEEQELRTNEQIDNEIEAQKKLREAELEQFRKKGKNTIQFKEAQAVYIQGFRDYKQGRFGRAIESFQACLSLFPDHALCTRYLRLAQRKYQELIQYSMILGRKYSEQNQYKSCMSAFRNVMFMVKDRNSKVYKEAKANYNSCRTFAKDTY